MLNQLPELENIFDNIDMGITIFDDKGTFLWVNRAVLQYTGRSRKDYLNYTVYDYIRRGIYTESAVDKVYRTKRTVTQIHTTISAKGERVERMVTVTPIFDAQGNIVYAISCQVDANEVAKQFKQAKALNVFSQSLAAQAPKETVIAASPAMKTILADAARVAQTDASILLLGESGCGKEVVARYIHDNSRGKDKEMVAINCASLPEALLEAELFGYEKGAFTGASASGKVGFLEAANDSTLLLDEINSMPLSLQAKLLRVLETRKVIRVGSVKPRPVSFKLIAAANVDLAQCVRNGTFRSDLYYRLNVIPFTIPPLRDRKEDIIPLAKLFLRHFCDKYSMEKEFSNKVYQALLKYTWPGNVRELRNLVERMVVMSEASVVKINRIPVEMIDLDAAQLAKDAKNGKEEKENDECRKIKAALLLNSGHRENTAKYLGISRRTLQYKLKKYGIK